MRCKKCEEKAANRMKKKTPAQEFVSNIKNDPDKIIAWAKSEIAEYQELVDILERAKKNESNKKKMA
jgi:hypothetical protein